MSEQRFSDRDIKAAVRQRYASAIQGGSSCCGPGLDSTRQSASSCCGATPGEPRLAEMAGYGAEDLAGLPVYVVEHSFGCGNPLAFSAVQPGQVVLDIGSGAGIDCLLAAEKVGPTGKVIGLDMTPEMIERARQNAHEAGATQAEFRLGDAQKMPVEDASVDWVISNCVINLSPDKPAVFREIARVLRPGGRIAISDIVAAELPDAVRQSQDAWTGCLAGAISEEEYVAGLEAAGLQDVRVSARTVYDATQLASLFGSACCGVGQAGPEVQTLARQAAGKIWSARFEGVKGDAPRETDSLFSPAVKELVAIGAAIAANCEPCFKYHYDQARKLGVTSQDMARAGAAAQAVKETPARAMLALAERYLGKASQAAATASRSCCGPTGSAGKDC
ncbi:MAG TPA: arsenite methyltransferase [Candidatus Sulfotelmatobacter sp.]|nr:arsenite methyltransferase [Candidatus Sulfotelmatobacter sp.]